MLDLIPSPERCSGCQYYGHESEYCIRHDCSICILKEPCAIYLGEYELKLSNMSLLHAEEMWALLLNKQMVPSTKEDATAFASIKYKGQEIIYYAKPNEETNNDKN